MVGWNYNLEFQKFEGATMNIIKRVTRKFEYRFLPAYFRNTLGWNKNRYYSNFCREMRRHYSRGGEQLEDFSEIRKLRRDRLSVLGNVNCNILSEKVTTQLRDIKESIYSIPQNVAVGYVEEIFEIMKEIDPKLRSFYKSFYVPFWIQIQKNNPGIVEAGSAFQWHTDDNPVGVMKVFVYLNDVKESNGAFRAFPKWMTTWLFLKGFRSNGIETRVRAQPLVERFYKRYPNKLRILEGRAGTILGFDNNLVHKGTLPRAGCRYVIQILLYPKVLHLASFAGNTGDIESQRSFRKWFQLLLPEFNITWVNFEIRNFYRKVDKALDEFFSLAKECNLLVIGGGNFLELWPENTASGTSLPFSAENLISLEVPIFFNSLGVDNGQGVSNSSAQKFVKFINLLLEKGNTFLTVRNDGSWRTVQPYIEDHNKHLCFELPDHGFFALRPKVKSSSHSKIVGINLAIDMPKIRFAQFQNEADLFLVEIAKALEDLSLEYPNLVFRLIPHVYSDLKAYVFLLENVSDNVRRERIKVSEYDVTTSSQGAYRSYQDLSMLIAMRFHSNIFGISSLVPTMSIESYPQITKLLDGLNIGANHRYSTPSPENLRLQIIQFVRNCMNEDWQEHTRIYKVYMEESLRKRHKTGALVRDWVIDKVKND